MTNIWLYAITVFATQVIFIYCRTWNVKAISAGNIPAVLMTGALIHLAWLVSIAIGAASMHKLMVDFKLEYLPVVCCSLCGGLLGSYLAMKKKK